MTMTLTKTPSPVSEHKSLFGGSTKVLDPEEGVVEAIIAVTGIEDEVGDIIVPGAFRKTLATRMPKGVDAHAWDTPTAKPLAIKELMPGDPGLPKTTARGEPWPREAGALLVKTQFNLNTTAGRDAYENVRFFEGEQEWSIGYNVPRGGSRIDHKKGIRYLDTVDLFEYSTVLFGAMPLAGTHSVKSLGGMIVGGTPMEAKTLPGSYEDRSGQVERAVAAELSTSDEDWVSIRATFDDHVIVCHYPGGISGHRNMQEWDIPYTIVGDEVTLGTPAPVKIVEQVAPDDAPTTPAAPDESAMERKAETAYLSPSELQATASLRDYI